MFNHHYFGQAYTGQSFFSDGIGDVALMTQFVVSATGSYAPVQESDGIAGYVLSSTGSFNRVITSRGTP